MAYNDNVVFKTSTTATIDDLFSWNKSTGQIAAKTDNIPIVPGTVYFTADGHIVHDLAQNNRLWMSKNAYSAIYAEDVAETNTDIANAIKYSIHYVEGPTTDTTPGTWTGTINGITELYDGLTIIYVPAVAGGSSTTTLNINGLGAKTCYYSNTSAITTHYSVGTPILLTYRNNCWRRADYNSNTTYSAMSVAEMRAGTATSERLIRADYLKTFLSTLGGTNLTLTHSNSAPYLQLNHNPSGITAGTYGNSNQQTPSYGGTFNIPYFTVDAQGHITNASTTTVKIPESDNTDYKVRQTPINSNDNNNYRILLSNSANDTEEDNVSKKYINLQYNPSTNKVTTGNLDLTGNLQISGNATLNNNTSIENAIVNSLLVNGNSSFINDVNFTQIPTAPTATAGDNTTKLATTAFVATALGAYLPLIGGTMVNTASNRASIIFPAFNGAVGGQSNLSINGATTGDDTADNRANITITTQQNKRKVIYGSSGITIDNTADSTGWAGSFAQIRYVDTSDNLKKIFTALGYKGAIDQLDYIYMGGTYTNPAMKLTPNNTFTFNTKVILTDSQTSSTVGSSLLKIYNSGTHAVGLELQRNSGASWQIVNESGTFIIRQNYTSGSAQTTYNTNTQLSIAYNTGNVIIGGELSAGKTTDTTTKKITTRNSYGSISLTTGSSNGIGVRGLYDNTFSRWLIYFSSDETNNTFANGKVYIPKWGGVGSSSQPVYFNSNGEPIAITGSLANDITGNAATATNLSGTKTANYIYAGPSSGNAAAPTFRALVTNDIPNLPGSKITSGTISADRLPKASSSAFGIIKSGTGLSIDNGVASVNLSDLGLSSAMHFIGISSTSISQGGNQNPTIDNNEISVKQNGDVVLWNTQEFVWNGSSWQLLGDENSYKIKQTSVSDPTVASNATAISFISNITQDTNGVITATKKDLQVASTSEPGITQYTADNLNTWLNQLTLGSSDPQDNDYYISQYSNGGTTYTSYHRRPMSKLWNYIRGKADNRYSQTDTKNTAGSTSTNDKIYIIGAKEQSANPQTYSADSTVYISNKSIYANNFIGTAKQSYGLIGITSITNTSGLYFYKGSITNNDPNSTDYTKWSCPNHIANTTVGTNSLILRLLWGNNYFKDIYMSPNSNKILYRQVFESNGTPIAGEWRYIVQSSTDGVGDANTPIYITNSGNATAITGAIANDTTGNAATATQTKFLMNRGGSTVTIQDNIWNHNQTPFNHTNAATVWHQRWKQSGLTYTPLGGDATAITDSGDLVYWLSAGNTSNVLFLNMAIDGMIYAGGGFKGDLNGTATNATQLISNDRMDYGWNGINYFNILTSNQSAAKVNDTPFSSNVWTHILRFNHHNASGYYTDLAIPFSQNSIYYKRIAAGSLQNSTTNGGWIKVLDQLNYTSYTVTKTGSGASGTWNINISGNAATATKATQDENGNIITSTYLPLSGGTMTGNLRWNDLTALPSTTTTDYFLTIDTFANGGTTKYITKGNALKSLISSSSIGTSLRPVYWTGSSFSQVNWFPSYCTVDGHNRNNYNYHRIATLSIGGSTWTDRDAVLVIRSRYNTSNYGIVKISGRANNNQGLLDLLAYWLIRSGFEEDSILICRKRETTDTSLGDTQVDVYLKTPIAYPRIYVYMLVGPSHLNGFQLINSEEKDNSVLSYNTSDAENPNVIDINNSDLKGSYEVYIRDKDENGNLLNSFSGYNPNNSNSQTTPTAQSQVYTHIKTALDAGSVSRAKKSSLISTNQNAIVYYTDTTGTFGQKASANGALYATSANGSLQWGTLPMAQGGTGATTAAGARTNLGLGTMATEAANNYIAKSIGTAKGDIIYWSAANTPARLNIGSVGQVLKVSSNGIPVWSNESIIGVKGNAEDNYRTGNVNITPANILGSSSTAKFWRGDNTWSNLIRDAHSKSLSTFVAIAGSDNAWNKAGNYNFAISNSNNMMVFNIGGTSNDRNAYIQVGHNSPDPYGNITGNLYLNKLGGQVYINENYAAQVTSVTSGQVMVADGTTGGIKTTGYTIATSVPSSAVFTDYRVKQDNTTTSNWRKILLHCKDDATSTAGVTNSTNQVFAAVGVSVQPSTGAIRATKYNIADHVSLEYNSTLETLNFVFS